MMRCINLAEDFAKQIAVKKMKYDCEINDTIQCVTNHMLKNVLHFCMWFILADNYRTFLELITNIHLSINVWYFEVVSFCFLHIITVCAKKARSVQKSELN